MNLAYELYLWVGTISNGDGEWFPVCAFRLRSDCVDYAHKWRGANFTVRNRTTGAEISLDDFLDMRLGEQLTWSDRGSSSDIPS